MGDGSGANGNGTGYFGSDPSSKPAPDPNGPPGPDVATSANRRRAAYATGGRIARERMRQDDPDSAQALREVEAADVVVVRGCYDRVELVLDALDLPYTAIDPEQLSHARLRPEHLLVVNCPGQVSAHAVECVRDFVAGGGSLFTTDWALRHLVEPAFPGTIAFNERPTHDDVVRIDVCENDNPFLRGVLETGDDPQWWLEGSSYPIRVLDPRRVEVLITSRELEDRYGEAPVAVLFHHGSGEVFHMVSHYYLQRTELRSARHQQSGVAYAQEKGVALGVDEARLANSLSLGEVESAASSVRLMANLVAEKKRRSHPPRDSGGESMT